MAIAIKRTSDVTVNGVKTVVYGAAGCGKTVLCSTAPAPIILSAEGGLLSLVSLDLPYMEINTLNDLDLAYKQLRKDEEFKTICVDSLSEIAELVIKELKPNHKDPRKAYGELADGMMAMIRKFRDLKGKNVVFTTKMEIRLDEATDTQIHSPILPGQILKTQLPYLVDEVFCMQVDRKGERFLQTSSDRQRQCKDRSGKLDAKEPANLTHIFSKITGN